MANEFRHQYTVTPQVMRVSSEEKKIVIHARQGHGVRLLDQVDNFHLIAQYQPRRGEDRQWLNNLPCQRMERQANGDLWLFAELPQEGEYIIYLTRGAEGSPRSEVMTFSVYALEEDLFKLRPWKGDLHIHSCESDGKETPEFTMASARRNGCDFMTISDHLQYAPSLAAIEAAQECSCDILVIPGEEVHLPDNATHIVNFGGNWSINDLARRDEEKFRQEVEEYGKDLPGDVHPINRFQIGATEWVFDRIREAGGVSIFSHPYWRAQYRNHIDEVVINYLLEHQKFDAMEVFGGFTLAGVESNMLSLARWQSESAKKGKQIPVVGVSDCHGCDTHVANWYYTVIFAEKLEFASLADAIRSNRSVAFYAVPGQYPIIAGDFRLTKFSYFLHREFYPRHNEICHLEGTIMRSYYSEGSINAPEVIKALSGSVAEFMDSFWEK